MNGIDNTTREGGVCVCACVCGGSGGGGGGGGGGVMVPRVEVLRWCWASRGNCHPENNDECKDPPPSSPGSAAGAVRSKPSSSLPTFATKFNIIYLAQLLLKAFEDFLRIFSGFYQDSLEFNKLKLPSL